MKDKEPNSGAHGGAEKTSMRLIGCLEDTDTLEDVESAARRDNIDVALELENPQHLKLYALVPEVS